MISLADDLLLLLHTLQHAMIIIDQYIRSLDPFLNAAAARYIITGQNKGQNYNIAYASWSTKSVC
jgi:hypothetical protein